jgi:Ser/Thr protein kinase RdoA (MazF antagonist)
MSEQRDPSRHEELRRLRRLGRAALAAYGLDGRLTLQRHEHNTTFRVDAPGGPYLLRINRPGVHTSDTIGSELAWLGALRRDTDLGVPEPVAARDGSLMVVAAEPGVPAKRFCVLLRWLDGRFVDRRLAPVHLRRVGALAARLHEHAAHWTPPRGFLRPQVDTLTSGAKAGLVATTPVQAGDRPTREDGDRALRLVDDLVSAPDAALFAAALEVVRGSTRALAEEPDAVGLIHGDLHYENVLFRGGEARAIDFDDCGWGLELYDLAVTLSELEGRPRYGELREALLDGYARIRRLPDDHVTHLAALALLRRLQLLVWILESRAHPAFRDRWQEWARDELDAIARGQASLRRAARVVR